MIIDRFEGKYFFLSNFYPCKVGYEGIIYESSEEAFQAQKTLDIEKRKTFVGVGSGQAKRMGRALKDLRSDWEEVKDDVMREIVWAKFMQNQDLKEKLLATGNNVLMEGNGWGDKYWGCDSVTHEGKNKLGEILMLIRSIIPMVSRTDNGGFAFNIQPQSNDSDISQLMQSMPISE